MKTLLEGKGYGIFYCDECRPYIKHALMNGAVIESSPEVRAQWKIPDSCDWWTHPKMCEPRDFIKNEDHFWHITTGNKNICKLSNAGRRYVLKFLEDLNKG